MLLLSAGWVWLIVKSLKLSRCPAGVCGGVKLASFFSLLITAYLGAYPLLYPLSLECRIGEGEMPLWNTEAKVMCVWCFFGLATFLAAAITAGFILPRAVVRSLSAGGFSAGRYRLAVAVLCASVIVPYLLLIFGDKYNPVPRGYMLRGGRETAWLLSALLIITLLAAVVQCEKARRKELPVYSPRERNTVAAGCLVSAGLMSSAVYYFAISIMGEYKDCSCELAEYAVEGIGRLIISLIILAAVAGTSAVCRRTGRWMALYKQGK